MELEAKSQGRLKTEKNPVPLNIRLFSDLKILFHFLKWFLLPYNENISTLHCKTIRKMSLGHPSLLPYAVSSGTLHPGGAYKFIHKALDYPGLSTTLNETLIAQLKSC